MKNTFYITANTLANINALSNLGFNRLTDAAHEGSESTRVIMNIVNQTFWIIDDLTLEQAREIVRLRFDEEITELPEAPEVLLKVA